MNTVVERLILPGHPEVEVRLRRSSRARRLSLRVSRMDGRVTLSVPSGLRLAAAERFLAEKAGWVRGHLADRPEILTPSIGSLVPIEGILRQVAPADDGRLRLTPSGLAVTPSRPVGAQISGLLRTLARDRLARACDDYSAALAQRYTRLTLRDTRSRWGSCTCEGRLMFSWRLAMAPPDVLRYVAAHEVAHLVEMNHSRAFWRVVETLCPDFAIHRAWLRTDGNRLHHIRFAA